MILKGVKYEAIVESVDDPKSLGRIKAEIIGFEKGFDSTPWCYPVSVLAGPGYGFYFLPQVSDIVYVEQTADGDWVWTGFCWTSTKAKPAEGTSTVRVLKTPTGHLLKFDESGSVTLEHHNGSRVELGTDDLTVEHSGGSTVTLESGGNIVIQASGTNKIHLNGSTGQVITTECICAYTGGPHVQGSLTVKAKGII